MKFILVEKTKFRNSTLFPTKIFVEKTKFCDLLEYKYLYLVLGDQKNEIFSYL